MEVVGRLTLASFEFGFQEPLIDVADSKVRPERVAEPSPFAICNPFFPEHQTLQWGEGHPS